MMRLYLRRGALYMALIATALCLLHLSDKSNPSGHPAPEVHARTCATLTDVEAESYLSDNCTFPSP